MGNKSDSRNKYLFKNAAVFLLGNLATKLIAFFLVPLYTHTLSTYDYGIIDLVVTICTITVPIITLNVSESVMRFNLDKNVDSKVITKVGITVLIVGCFVASVIIPLSNMFEKTNGLGMYIYLFVIFSAISQVLLGDLRGKEHLIQYSVGNVLNTMLIVIFNIIFLLWLQLGMKGYIAAYTIANAVVSLYAFIAGKGYKSIFISIDAKKMREMLKYSIVLIPNSFMWWIMNSSDHLMVTSMIGPDANGIYAISYKIPTLITTFSIIFNQAWQYSAIREEGSKDEEAYNNSVFKTMITIIMLVGICMVAFIKVFLKIYVAIDYYSAWKYTPFLIVGCVYLNMGTFMSSTYTVHKDSWGFLLSGSIGALFNIILNFILIPIIGVYGAAIATCISYIIVFIFRLFHTRKYIYYNIAVKEFVVGSILLFLSCGLMFFETFIGQLLQIIIALIYLYIFRKTWVNFFYKIYTMKRNKNYE